MKHFFLFVIGFLSLNFAVKAEYYNPKPLRILVEEHDYIVFGHLLKSTTVPEVNDEPPQYGRKAVIVVKEWLKGALKDDTIEVGYRDYTSHALTPYRENTMVLLFLNYNSTDNFFSINDLRDDAKTLSYGEFTDYKTRIEGLQQILKIEDKKVRKSATVDWLVQCMENKTTLGEGALELFHDPYNDYCDTSRPYYGDIINPDQKERIKKVINKKDWLYYALYDILYQGDEKEEQYLIESLKTWKQNDHWSVWDYMLRLQHRDKTKEAEKIQMRVRRLQYDDRKKAELEEMIRRFIELVA